MKKIAILEQKKYEPDRLWPFVYDHDEQFWFVDWMDVGKFLIGVVLITASILVVGVLFYTGLMVID